MNNYRCYIDYLATLLNASLVKTLTAETGILC